MSMGTEHPADAGRCAALAAVQNSMYLAGLLLRH